MENINLNQTTCLRDVYRLTHTEVHNVCNGTIINVPYGIDFWIAWTFILAMLVGIIAIVRWVRKPERI